MLCIINLMKIFLNHEEQTAIQQLGLALRTARIAANQTQDELAARIGVSRWTVAAMEKDGAGVSLATWIKACNLLGHLKSWDAVLQPPDDPFARYDREQAARNQLLKTRVRKHNAPPNS